jgi:hypothetical protein
MKSKHSPEKYKEWIQRFFRTICGPIVFFTEESSLPFLESCPRISESVRFVVLPRSEWKANDRAVFPEGLWESQWAKDPEKGIHSPDLYKVWYEKKEFVLRAAALNPFQTEKFVWTDSGIMRYPEFEAILKDRYPVSSRIPCDRMMLLNNTPFTQSDEIDLVAEGVTIKGGGKDRLRIGGGILAGTAGVWKKWSELCDDAIKRYLKAGLFIGKDQTIFTTVVLENKKFVSLLDYKKIAPESWFYLLLYLGVTDRIFSVLRSERADREKWTYNRFM